MPKGVHAPHGYTSDWKIDDKTAADIQLIFQYACAGLTYKAMLKHLPGWNQDRIYYFIQQDVYTGILRYNQSGVLHVEDNHHLAIISQEVFEAVQVLKQMNLLRTTRRMFTAAEMWALDYAWNAGAAEWGEETLKKLWDENGNKVKETRKHASSSDKVTGEAAKA